MKTLGVSELRVVISETSTLGVPDLRENQYFGMKREEEGGMKRERGYSGLFFYSLPILPANRF